MKLIIDIAEDKYTDIKNGYICQEYADEIINLIPTAKIYEERPKGKWIENYDKTDGFTWLTCTRCMCKAYEEGYNFCPNCGAYMRGDRQ